MRSVHLQRLEDAIRLPMPDGGFEPSFHTDAGLVYRPDHLLEKPRIRIFFALITDSSYALIIVVLMGFTWVILANASGPWNLAKYLVAVAYGAIETVQVVGFVWSLGHDRFLYKHTSAALPH
jgi:hypothetical protein